MFSLYHFQRGLQTRTLGSRGYFFLIDTAGSRRSRVNEAQSAEEKKEKKNPLEPRVSNTLLRLTENQ